MYDPSDNNTLDSSSNSYFDGGGVFDFFSSVGNDFLDWLVPSRVTERLYDRMQKNFETQWQTTTKDLIAAGLNPHMLGSANSSPSFPLPNKHGVDNVLDAINAKANLAMADANLVNAQASKFGIFSPVISLLSDATGLKPKEIVQKATPEIVSWFSSDTKDIGDLFFAIKKSLGIGGSRSPSVADSSVNSSPVPKARFTFDNSYDPTKVDYSLKFNPESVYAKISGASYKGLKASPSHDDMKAMIDRNFSNPNNPLNRFGSPSSPSANDFIYGKAKVPKSFKEEMRRNFNQYEVFRRGGFGSMRSPYSRY